jgi:hypothetical protein
MLGRYAEAVPFARAAVADAEADQPPKPNRIAMRAFVLAQALWEVGSRRDRDHARALIAQARTKFAEARTFFAADTATYGAALDQVDRRIAALDRWAKARP